MNKDKIDLDTLFKFTICAKLHVSSAVRNQIMWDNRLWTDFFHPILVAHF